MNFSDVIRLVVLAAIWGSSFIFMRIVSPVLGPVVTVNLLVLAVVCSAIAYLLYYKLLSNVGPTKAYTVTFIIPIFGMLWAHLFLDEVITMQMLLGSGLIISGTKFVVK